MGLFFSGYTAVLSYFILTNGTDHITVAVNFTSNRASDRVRQVPIHIEEIPTQIIDDCGTLSLEGHVGKCQ